MSENIKRIKEMEKEFITMKIYIILEIGLIIFHMEKEKYYR